MEAMAETRPSWYRSFILGEWGAFEGQAYAEFEEAIHVVEPFAVPEHWERFESMDHGAANPTAWHAWAADEDGNVVVFGEHYEAGQLLSHHARWVLALRRGWHPGRMGRPVVWADPSTGAKFGTTTRWGEPATVRTEYAEHGIVLTGANNDRAAGYARLLELLHVVPSRVAPPWAQVRETAGGAPRLYLSSACERLIEQLRSAPIAADGVNAGECVDPKWESQHGHAHASLRYGAMSRLSPSTSPPPMPATPEEEVAWRQRELLRLYEEGVDGPERKREYLY